MYPGDTFMGPGGCRFKSCRGPPIPTRDSSSPESIMPTPAAFNTPAPAFSLPATDGRSYTLDDIAGAKGTVIVFICNHCPYVKAVIDRLVADAKLLQAEGIGVAAICSNDARTHPDDS